MLPPSIKIVDHQLHHEIFGPIFRENPSTKPVNCASIIVERFAVQA